MKKTERSMYIDTDSTAETNYEQAEERGAQSKTDTLALDWLEGHMRIMGFWMDRLVSENGDAALIDTLHRQSTWLQQITHRLTAAP